jgi:hypothetical protein
MSTSTTVGFLFAVLFNKEQISWDEWNLLCNQDAWLLEGKINISFHPHPTEC